MVEIEARMIEMGIHMDVEGEEGGMDILVVGVIIIHHLGGFMIEVVEEGFIEVVEGAETLISEEEGLEDLHRRVMEIAATIVQMVEVEDIIITIMITNNKRVTGGEYNLTMEVVWGTITTTVMQINTPTAYHHNHLRPVITTTMMT